MNIIIVGLLILSVVMIIVISIFNKGITIKETLIQLSFSVFVIAGINYAGLHSVISDKMIVNGVVTGKKVREESCNQYWSSFPDTFCTNQITRIVQAGNTCTTVNNVQSCTPNYKTEYMSVFPWERKYYVYTTHNTYEIERVDSQGKFEPERFKLTNKNDTSSDTKNFANYVKASNNSLFGVSRYEDTVNLKYPFIYDYYKIDRVLTYDYNMLNDDLKKWNEDLSVLNSSLKNGNVILVFTNMSNDFLPNDLYKKWFGYKINDIVIVIGMEDNIISWVDVKSWSKNDLVNISIRDAILDTKELKREDVLNTIKTNVDLFYVQKEESEFEYLRDEINPPGFAIILSILLIMIGIPYTSYLLHKYDI